jgi:hypothetical protein
MFSLRVALFAMVITALPAAARAQDCQFSTENGIVHLLNDCQTSRSIEVDDGLTLDGGMHLIQAIDPADQLFSGGVIVARGGWVSVVNTRVSTTLLTGGCLEGDARLRGIYFDGASGDIVNNVVISARRAAGSCEEGNGIEVRNRDRDGAATDVVIQDNRIEAYQKTAIVIHGHVDAVIDSNVIGTPVARLVIVPNGIQIGPQATARVQKNRINGRFTGQVTAGAAVLLIQSGRGTIVDGNLIDGDSDVGIHVAADGAIVTNNVVRDTDPSGVFDVGIVNQGVDNLFINNSVSGFRDSFYGVETVPPPARHASLQIE